VREFLVPLALCTVCFHDLVHVFKSKRCVCDYVYNVYLVCELDLYLYLIVIWLKKTDTVRFSSVPCVLSPSPLVKKRSRRFFFEPFASEM
jgi:hypothetical protein